MRFPGDIAVRIGINACGCFGFRRKFTLANDGGRIFQSYLVVPNFERYCDFEVEYSGYRITHCQSTCAGVKS